MKTGPLNSGQKKWGSGWTKLFRTKMSDHEPDQIISNDNFEGFRTRDRTKHLSYGPFSGRHMGPKLGLTFWTIDETNKFTDQIFPKLTCVGRWSANPSLVETVRLIYAQRYR